MVYDDVLVSAPNSSDAYIVLGQAKFCGGAQPFDCRWHLGRAYRWQPVQPRHTGARRQCRRCERRWHRRHPGRQQPRGWERRRHLRDLFGTDGALPKSISLSGLEPGAGCPDRRAALRATSPALRLPAPAISTVTAYDDVIIGAPRYRAGRSAHGRGCLRSIRRRGRHDRQYGARRHRQPGSAAMAFEFSPSLPTRASAARLRAPGTSTATAYDDLILGAGAAVRNGVSLGEAYVVFGSGAALAPELSLATLDGSNGFSIVDSLSSTGQLGGSVSSAGDFNARRLRRSAGRRSRSRNLLARARTSFTARPEVSQAPSISPRWPTIPSAPKAFS